MMQVPISCPACGVGSVIIEPRLLATGESFACTACDASVRIGNDSIGTLKGGIGAFEAMQRKVASGGGC